MTKSFSGWGLGVMGLTMLGCAAQGAPAIRAGTSPACRVEWRDEPSAGDAPAGAIIVSAGAPRAEIEAKACAHGATAILATPVESIRFGAGRRTFVIFHPAQKAATSTALSSDPEDFARDFAREQPDGPTALAGRVDDAVIQ